MDYGLATLTDYGLFEHWTLLYSVSWFILVSHVTPMNYIVTMNYEHKYKYHYQILIHYQLIYFINGYLLICVIVKFHIVYNISCFTHSSICTCMKWKKNIGLSKIVYNCNTLYAYLYGKIIQHLSHSARIHMYTQFIYHQTGGTLLCLSCHFYIHVHVHAWSFSQTKVELFLKTMLVYLYRHLSSLHIWPFNVSYSFCLYRKHFYKDNLYIILLHNNANIKKKTVLNRCYCKNHIQYKCTNYTCTLNKYLMRYLYFMSHNMDNVCLYMLLIQLNLIVYTLGTHMYILIIETYMYTENAVRQRQISVMVHSELHDYVYLFVFIITLIYIFCVMFCAEVLFKLGVSTHTYHNMSLVTLCYNGDVWKGWKGGAGYHILDNGGYR